VDCDRPIVGAVSAIATLQVLTLTSMVDALPVLFNNVGAFGSLC